MNKGTDKKELKFEEAMAELEDIASKLSEGDIPLDESVKLFERGVELKKKCETRLEEARVKIKVLTEESGEFREEEFDETGK